MWNFHIGGYQVFAHYQKIVVALNETIRIMGKIDEVIEQHGGWPDAFQTVSSQVPTRGTG